MMITRFCLMVRGLSALFVTSLPFASQMLIVSELRAQSYTCPHGYNVVPGHMSCRACQLGIGSGSSSGGTAQQAADAFTKPFRDRHEREQRWSQEQREQQIRQNESDDARDERRWLLQQQLAEQQRRAEAERLARQQKLEAELAAARDAAEKERIRKELAELQNSKTWLAGLAGNLSPSLVSTGTPPATLPPKTQWPFSPELNAPSGIYVAPSGVLVDRDGYLIENISRDAADLAHAADQLADRRREENVRADWERMQKKALQDWREGAASGSLTWDDHPARHGSTPEQQARYWTLLRQKVDDNTVRSLEGTGYDIAKVKSDARDQADYYLRTHLRQTMTETSETRPWRTKTITEAERDPVHLNEIAEIRKNIDERLGSRPAFGPGSDENLGK